MMGRCGWGRGRARACVEGEEREEAGRGVFLPPIQKGRPFTQPPPSSLLRPSFPSSPPHQSPSPNCTSKLLVTLAVDAGSALAGTTRLEATLACAGSPSGVCPCPCSRATAPGCACVDFGAPLAISLVKTPAYATFPLTYVSSFNAKPTEQVVRTGLGFPAMACADGGDPAASPAPTCGWATDPASGAPVPASQGFCCACSLDQAGSDTFGGGSGQSELEERIGERERERERGTREARGGVPRPLFSFHPPTPPPTLLATRAGLDCNLLASWLILPGSAHCLRHDPLWYAGYDVGPGAVDFAINVTATRGNSSAGPASTASLALSPAVPAAASPGAGIAARLLGDLAAYRAMPEFGGHVLMVPFPPGEKRNTQAGTERETGGGGGRGGCFFLFFSPSSTARPPSHL